MPLTSFSLACKSEAELVVLLEVGTVQEDSKIALLSLDISYFRRIYFSFDVFALFLVVAEGAIRKENNSPSVVKDHPGLLFGDCIIENSLLCVI